MGGRFVDFCRFHCLTIGGTLLEYRSRHRFDYFAISSRLRSFFLDVHNKKGTYIGLESEYLLIVNYNTFACVLHSPLHARLESHDLPSSIATACVIQLLLDKVRAISLIDVHWAVIKNALFSSATQDGGHIAKGRHKIWLIAES